MHDISYINVVTIKLQDYHLIFWNMQAVKRPKLKSLGCA